MSLSWCSSWPELSLHYIEINNTMYAEKTLLLTVLGLHNASVYIIESSTTFISAVYIETGHHFP